MSNTENRMMPEHEAVKLLDGVGVRYPSHVLADSADAAVKAASEINGPVVMKAVSPQVVHKSDAGAVLVNLTGERGGSGRL